MFEFLKGLPAVVPVAIVGDSGPLTLDAPPTVDVADADGVSVASGVTTGTNGDYTFSMPSQGRLGPYTVTVTGLLGGQAVTSAFPVACVGAFAFSVVDLRAFDDAVDTRYTDDAVKRARGFVQDEFRRISGRHFTPRAAVETVTVVNGSFYVDNVDVTRLVSLKYAGVAADLTYVTLSPIGVGAGAPTDGVAVVEYEFGAPFVPADVKRAAMMRASTVLYATDSGIPDRATSYNVDGAQYALATAGRSGFETGIPEVDAILARYRMRPPGVA